MRPKIYWKKAYASKPSSNMLLLGESCFLPIQWLWRELVTLATVARASMASVVEANRVANLIAGKASSCSFEVFEFEYSRSFKASFFDLNL